MRQATAVLDNPGCGASYRPPRTKARVNDDINRMSDARAVWHLDNWAAWMSGKGNRLGYPSRSPVIGRSHTTDFDAMCASADTRCAVAADAVIDDLPARERAAVYHIHLAAVWRVRGDIEDAYADACMSVAIKLTAKGIL